MRSTAPALRVRDNGGSWHKPIFAGAAVFTLIYAGPIAAVLYAPASVMRLQILALYRNQLLLIVALVGAAVCWAPLFARVLGADRRRRLFDRHGDLQSIQDMNWSDFERLVGEAFRRWGYRVDETGLGGADGGVDLRLRKNGATTLVQCKHWKSNAVGAPYVREMLGLMIHHNAQAIAIVTSGKFTRQAWAFAEGKPIELIDGRKLASMIARSKS